MRKFFVSEKDTHRVELEDGQWIDVLSVCSYGTRKKAMSAMLKPKATGNAANAMNVNMDFDVSAFNDVLLKDMIVDWSFTDDSGNKVPVTPANIDDLAADIAQVVVEEIGKLNPSRPEPEKNAL